MDANTNVQLVVPPRQWARFREEVLSARRGREEVIGFFFCTRHRTAPGSVRLLPRVWVVPAPDCYDRQSPGGLALNQSFNSFLVKNYVARGLDVVHIHTHPGLEPPEFSRVDDRHENEYAEFLAGLRGQPSLISGVFNERLEHGKFRIWPTESGDGTRMVDFSHGLASADSGDGGSLSNDPRFDRQRIFGAGVQEALGQITVGLVGCGGLGAVFAEQLARLGVRRWVLIDPDRLDATNLNRMPCATPAMAAGDWPKVRYVEHLITRSWPAGSHVRKSQAVIETTRAGNLLAACDLIVAATDNHRSRMIAQQLALRYVRPLLCLGVDIITSDSGGLQRLLYRVTMPPVDGGWCLMCGDVIDPQQAALEAAPKELAADAASAGYVRGIAAPAVYWLNSACASVGVYAVHGILSGFIEAENGIDWVVDMEVATTCQKLSDTPLCLRHVSVPKHATSACLHCAPEGEWAAGEPKRRARSVSRKSSAASI